MLRAGESVDAVTPTAARYVLLVFVLSAPFYVFGATGYRLPGLPILPASALMTFVPVTAALILRYRENGAAGAFELLKRALDVGSLNLAGWYLVAFLFMPAVCVLEYGVLRITGSAVPTPEFAPAAAAFQFVAFFIGAIGEEAGWQGYAYPALRARRSAVGATVILGVVWALWHLIPFVQLGRKVDWIFWQLLSTVALRFIIVWLTENTSKNIVIAVLFHTMVNVSWALFPVAGSFYDPFVTFLILAPVTGLLWILCGPATTQLPAVLRALRVRAPSDQSE